MRFFRSTLLASLLFAALQLPGARYSGSVRAADQPVPGATITAHQGETKVTAFTDENGRFQMNLPPGDWNVQVEMFEFTSASEKVTAGSKPIIKDWTLEMPRLDQRAGATAPATPAPAPAGGGRRGRGQFRNGGGRGGFAPGARRRTTNGATQPGFQSAAVRPTQTPAAENSQTPLEVGDIGAGGLETGDAEEAFLVNGSTSGGLAAASDDENRRQRAQGGGRGGPGGAGLGFADASLGGAALGLPPGMSDASSNDSLGLGGFGASAINGGFGVGAGADGGGGQVVEEADAALAVGEEDAVAGEARGGGGRGGGRGNQNARRGPYNGQFANFGNRRRTQPPYTGSVSLTAQNSALERGTVFAERPPIAEALFLHEQFHSDDRRSDGDSEALELAAGQLQHQLPRIAEPEWFEYAGHGPHRCRTPRRFFRSEIHHLRSAERSALRREHDSAIEDRSVRTVAAAVLSPAYL